MSAYQDLQKRAAELGIDKVVGVPKEELKRQIEEKESKVPPQVKQANTNTTEELSKNKVTGSTCNIALIYRGAQKVREYSLSNHGENFLELARQYVSHNSGLTITMEDSSTYVKCPNCGTAFRPK